MHHAKRLSLVAVALIGASIVGCSKESDDKKKEEPKEQPPTPESAGLGKPAAAQLAMSGFLGAAKQAPNQPKAVSGGGGFSGLFGGGLGGGGGLGAAMGGMLGGGGLGGGGTAAPVPQADKPVAVDVGEGEQPPPEPAGGNNPFPPNMKLPPPGKAGGDCVAVADRLMVLVTAMIDEQMKAQMATMDEATREMMKAQIAQYMNSDMIKNEMVKACTSQNWSQQLRDCVLLATTVDDMMKCEQYAPKGAAGVGGGNDPDDYTDDVAAPEATAPAWTGGNSCEDVGKRMQQLYTLSMGDQSQWPDESKKQVADQLAAANAQLVQACKDASFSEPVRSCLVKASNLEGTQACWELMAGSP